MRLLRVDSHLSAETSMAVVRPALELSVPYYTITKHHPLPALGRRGDGVPAASRSISGSSISARPSASDIKSSSVKRPGGTRAERGIGVMSIQFPIPCPGVAS